MARALAAVLAVLGLLPLANWIGGGHSAPWFQDRLDGWVSGGAIAVGIAAIAVIAFGRWPTLWRDGAWHRIGARWERGGRAADVAIAAVTLVLCAIVAHVVLSARPLLIDEIVQVYQARILASGHLWLPAPAHPEFTSAQHLLDWGGKVFGQFPAGGSALLAIGTVVGAEWIIGPLATAIAVFAFARLVRLVEPAPSAGLAAVLLFATAPFVVFLGGSMMNHVTTSTALILAALALAHATRDDRAHPLSALACGLALGVAATIRPLDAGAFALPTAAWLAWRARGGTPHVGALLASGAGIAIPVSALLAVNWAQNGDPFLFGYIAMWGETHELGFHPTPWGEMHTPLRGLELVNLYLLRLQTYLFESAAPSLLFATAALAMTRRVTAFDRWMIGCGALLLAGYFAYWHDGFYLGPRFVLPLVPLVVLWTARLPGVLADRGIAIPIRRGVLVSGIVALVLGAVTLAPLRATQYRNGMLTMRIDVDRAAREAGVTGATVLVRESWGAQVMARLWAAGVSRSEAEIVYRTTDICELERALTRLEREHATADQFLAWIAPARADSSRLVAMVFALDVTPKVRPGSVMTGSCIRRLVEDRGGFTVFPPLLLARDSSNRYLRDLHGRDSLVVDLDDPRPIWLVVQPGREGAPLTFLPVDRDSMRAEWRQD